MKQLFLVKVTYTKQLDNGKFKRVVEPYLFDGHTFTDCEANVYEHLGSFIRGEFNIIKMDKFNVDYILFDQEEVFDKFFLVKQEFIGLEDNLIKEKVLVNAPSIVNAELRVTEHSEGWSNSTPEVKSISETKILEYFKSEEKKQSESFGAGAGGASKGVNQ
jgi:hypothetical protein